MGKLQPQSAEGASLGSGATTMPRTLPRTVARDEGGVPPMALVGVIALLVGLVSLPRFRAHVVRANRLDAPIVLGLLAAEVHGAGGAERGSQTPIEGAPSTLFELVQDTRTLKHRLRDARPLAADGQILDHHGYLFATGHMQDGAHSTPALVAWPLRFGETGDWAYAVARNGLIHVHTNGGLWSGAERALMDVDLEDEHWIPLPGRKGPGRK